MRISEVFFRETEAIRENPLPSYTHQTYASSIRFGKPFSLWAWLSAFFTQILSWFESSEEEASNPFVKVEKGDGKIHYRLEDSENEVRTGSRKAMLEDISFPDKEELDQLPDLIQYMMKKEKIDILETHNLQSAWLLWKAGLKTESTLPFTTSMKWVCDILKEAAKKRSESTLSGSGEKALRLIERSLMHSVAEDSMEMKRIAGPDPIDYHEFSPRQAIRRKASLEKSLGFAISLDAIIDKEGEGEFKTQLEEIRDSTHTSSGSRSYEREFALPLKSLFKLIDKLEKEVSRGQGPRAGTFQFKRK